jgi:hypothetical protein
MIRTFWLSFKDQDPDRFLGVAIFDMVVEGKARLTAKEIVTRSIELGANPGYGAVVAEDVTSRLRINPKYKNRLIRDEELLLKLGRCVECETTAHRRIQEECVCDACLAEAAASSGSEPKSTLH